jgi:hypothetical protein
LEKGKSLAPNEHTELMFGTKKAGKTLSGADNIGLALLRLDYLSHPNQMVDIQVKEGLKMRAFAPSWMV